MNNSDLNTDNSDMEPNLIYNIIVNSRPDVLFNYFIIIVVFIFISSTINITQNLLVGILVASIIIHYLYTHRQTYDISKLKERDEKFKMINTKNSVLKNHVKFVNIIYYIEDIKNSNIKEFNNLVSQIESFCNTFESCVTDFKLIPQLQSILIQLKINILISTNSLIYSIDNWKYEKKINRVRNKLEEILNEYLGVIFKNNKKNIYYNGFNNGTKIIDNTNIIPSNSFYSYDFDLGNGKFSDLLFLT
jgi:hypothetical protein